MHISLIIDLIPLLAFILYGTRVRVISIQVAPGPPFLMYSIEYAKRTCAKWNGISANPFLLSFKSIHEDAMRDSSERTKV